GRPDVARPTAAGTPGRPPLGGRGLGPAAQAGDAVHPEHGRGTVPPHPQGPVEPRPGVRRGVLSSRADVRGRDSGALRRMGSLVHRTGAARRPGTGLRPRPPGRVPTPPDEATAPR